MQAGGFLLIVFIGAWIGCLILGTLIRLRNRPANKKHIQHDYEEPTNSIPHGNFLLQTMVLYIHSTTI
jgi:hypothetical protein